MTVIDLAKFAATRSPQAPPTTPARPAPRPRRSSRSVVATSVGLGAFLVSFIGNWIPSLWYDEVATVTSATRTWSELGAEIHHVDAVHALYYSMMHVVFEVFGYSPLTLRLPSALAVGITAALVVILVSKLGSMRVALLSGIVFAIMPRVTWMGGEGRSYALTAMMAVLLTLALVNALRTSRRRWWVIYGVLAVLSTVLFAYLVFVIAAHVVSVVLRVAQQRVRRPDLIAFVVAVAAAAVIVSPFLALIHSERQQVAWLSSVNWDTLRQVYETQWFWGSAVGPAVSWALLAIGAARMMRARHTELSAFVLPAALVPTVIIVGLSALGEHLYSPRYLAMCTPFVAIVVALGIAWFRRRWVPVAVIAVLAAFALVHQVTAQRIVEAKSSSSWSEVASGLAAHRASLDHDARAAMIFGPVLGHPSATSRVIEYAYPQAFDDTKDLTLATPAAETGALWETHRSLESSTAGTAGIDVAYLITSVKQDRRFSTLATLRSDGWRQAGEWHYTGVNVVRYVRG
ncbi:MAG TPA: glycosyltransferase family 39 protein [Galbitalea sp.]